jgi:hypothetical protein
MLWGSKRYEGAVGKSGCEAMFLDTFVVAGAPKPSFDAKYFPVPPVCWVSYEDCEDKLRYYIKNESERLDIVKEQMNWANEYLNLEFVANHVLSNG